MKPRRDIDVFSLSFLDCICCGFGAIILLFVLSKTAEPVILEEISEDYEGIVAKLQEELHEVQGEVQIFNRNLTQKKEQLSQEQEMLARLQGDLSAIRGEFAASKEDFSTQNTIEGRLVAAHQELTEDMQKVLGTAYRRPATDSTIGGIPVDSEYIIFVIDTSGSMRDYSWSLLLEKVSETLEIYPSVKGIQVMNDMGNYMFSQYQAKWIPDTPARRRAILRRLKTWFPFSNSSPVEGIERAIRTFYAPDKKISVYVFGDEFTGPSIEEVVLTVDRLNRANRKGKRRVRIHAVGFPVQFGLPEHLQITGIRFATLMRILCHRNGGTFVGLNHFKP
jgi:hypothetical protein